MLPDTDALPIGHRQLSGSAVCQTPNENGHKFSPLAVAKRYILKNLSQHLTITTTAGKKKTIETQLVNERLAQTLNITR